MKLKDILTKVKNSSNNQTVWNPKKRKLKTLDMSEEDILDMEINFLKKGK